MSAGGAAVRLVALRVVAPVVVRLVGIPAPRHAPAKPAELMGAAVSAEAVPPATSAMRVACARRSASPTAPAKPAELMDVAESAGIARTASTARKTSASVSPIATVRPAGLTVVGGRAGASATCAGRPKA